MSPATPWMFDEEGLVAAAKLLGTCVQAGDVILLEGPMGAGKTTFTRGFAHGLAVHHPERVCSPTFNLCVVHDGPIPLVHVDLYRVEDAPPGAAAFEALGLADIDELAAAIEGRGGARGVVVIEWADRWLEPPADYLKIVLAWVEGQPQLRSMDVHSVGRRSDERAVAWRQAVERALS